MNIPEGTKVTIANQEDTWMVVGVGYLPSCVIVKNDRTGRCLDVFDDLVIPVTGDTHGN